MSVTSRVTNQRGDPSDRRSVIAGVGLLCAAAVLWSLNGALIKLIVAGDDAPDGVTIAFYRSLFAGLFLVPLALGRLHTLRPGHSTQDNAVDMTALRLPRPSATLFAIRGAWFGLRPAAAACIVFYTLMTACFVIANTMTEAANAIILQYTSTFWIFALSPWLLKESPNREDLWLLVVAMVGITVIFAGRASTDLLGLIVALLAGLFFGLLTLCIRQMRDSNPAAVTVANNLGSAILLVPFVLLFDSLVVDRRSLWLLLVLGVVQFGIPYYLYTLGLARIPAYRAALITLLEPLLVPVWTYWAVREAPPVTTLIGGALILVALVMILRISDRGSPVAVSPFAGQRTETGAGSHGENS